MTDKSWVVVVNRVEGTDECYIELNEDILNGSGFKIGDNLEWTDRGDGSWLLKKKVEKTWVMVETIHTFRMRYMVEAPAEHPEYALDTVTMDEAKEFSQEFIGDQIVSHRVVTEEEALKICDVDNSYCAKWHNDKKIETFFTEEGWTNEIRESVMDR
jgi:hypothetical protein